MARGPTRDEIDAALADIARALRAAFPDRGNQILRVITSGLIQPIQEVTLRDARSVIAADARDTRDVAISGIVDEIEGDQGFDEGDVERMIDESSITYNINALEYLIWSNNDGAYHSNFAESTDNWEAIATVALQTDIREEIDRRWGGLQGMIDAVRADDDDAEEEEEDE
jgi:hypothetical protein